MRDGLYLAVAPLPTGDRGALRAALDAAFPGAANAAYLDAVSAVGRPHVPARVTAARPGALSLLPRLIEQAGGHTSGLVLCRDAHGRPYVLDGEHHCPFDFNLSHSDAHVACALLVGGGRVGIDVEELIQPARAEAMIRRYATDGEKAFIQNNFSDPSIGFARLWTIREAMAKHAGGGEPLRYDAAAPAAGVVTSTARLADTGGYLTVCRSADRLYMPEMWSGSIPIVWEKGAVTNA